LENVYLEMAESAALECTSERSFANRHLMAEGQSEQVFTLSRELIHFECVARSATQRAEIALDRLEFIREA